MVIIKGGQAQAMLLVCLLSLPLVAFLLPHAFAQVNARYIFGRYVPPGIPFSASDADKAQGQIINASSVPLDDYPIGYEIVLARVDWIGSAQSPETTIEIRWTYINAGELLGVVSYPVSAGLKDGHALSWIGHGSGAGIYRPGNYAVDFVAPGLLTNRITFEVTSGGGSANAQSILAIGPLSIIVAVISLSLLIGLSVLVHIKSKSKSSKS